ncbi:carbohydrate kinase family protein [Methylococcus sp. EFPC2]|uniref:carbohydrate kinase family protein n=1 Tax=Methylococcus sp. EFPC2 TaxID=2812648 RepID=UPI0019689633|nr:PfkB family carbohydrate kinase [Methylococcus sp. EFPC2]QSA96292.1 carbohydrate kinase [Methylococcus sp. EFPC2]
MPPLDVLCVGHASYDLIFSVPHHPSADEKLFADAFLACGGGPAANAAVAVARFGLQAAFAGHLGLDLYGERHFQELREAGVLTDWLARDETPTPLSVVLVKPDGSRALVNYKGATRHLAAGAIDFSRCRPKVILFDGHEPAISLPLARRARAEGIATVLDAGSLHEGTRALMTEVDYLVASEKFARQCLGRDDEPAALDHLAAHAPAAVITLGERGLIWRRGEKRGALPAFPIHAVDTTGAGDVFHGIFAAALAVRMDWPDVLRHASAAGALCCAATGARTGIPKREGIDNLLRQIPA